MKIIKEYGEVRKRCTICNKKNTENCNKLVKNEIYKQIKNPLEKYIFADTLLCGEYQSMFPN